MSMVAMCSSQACTILQLCENWRHYKRLKLPLCMEMGRQCKCAGMLQGLLCCSRAEGQGTAWEQALSLSVAETSSVCLGPGALRPTCSTMRTISSLNCTASSWSTCAHRKASNANSVLLLTY